MSLVQEKEKLRKSVLEQLRKQPPDERERKSKKITEKLRSLPEFQTSKAIMFYVPMTLEVDTAPLLKDVLNEGRTVAVPFVDGRSKALLSVQIRDPDKDLSHGSYGILEPRPELAQPFDVSILDLVLVPGLAFDRKGHRLGRGKGYYDRFLKALASHVRRWGLAFDFQLLDSIPVDELDATVDKVITNKVVSS